jgi:predicted nucleotidyltransferase
MELKARVMEHYRDALKLYPEERIVGIFLQGSQNYYLDDEESDVDTKLLVVPTLDEIIFNRKPVSVTHIRDNDEHIDAKDVRLYWQCFRKGNPNFVEILFSRVRYVNPLYRGLWDDMVAMAEQVARVNPLASAKAMMGMVQEKFHAMEHRYPSRADIVDRFGYDPKQLSHLIRMTWFLNEYVKDERNYEDILTLYEPDSLGYPDESFRTYLKDIKRGRLFDLEDARLVAQEWLKSAEKALAKAKEVYSGEEDGLVSACMDKVLGEMIKRAIREELEA